jgi:ribosomal protein L32
MAVPKRRQSNSQSKMRTMHWRRKALDAARVALSLGKSLTTRKAKGFYYPPAPLDTDEGAQGFVSTDVTSSETE